MSKRLLLIDPASNCLDMALRAQNAGWDVKGDAPTYGFGSTGPDVHNGDRITPPKALERVLKDTQAPSGTATSPAFSNSHTCPVSYTAFDNVPSGVLGSKGHI